MAICSAKQEELDGTDESFSEDLSEETEEFETTDTEMESEKTAQKRNLKFVFVNNTSCMSLFD